jgi:hypothetical protein
MKWIRIFGIFFGVLAVCAGLAWVGGFNFDRRDGGVFFASLMSLLFATLSAVAAWELE